MSLTFARSIQHDAVPTYASVSFLSYNVSSKIAGIIIHVLFLFFLFICHGVTVGQQRMRSYMTLWCDTRSRPIWPKLAGSAPCPCPSSMKSAIGVRGGIFIFGSGIHISVPLPMPVFADKNPMGTTAPSSLLLLAVQQLKGPQAMKKMRRLRHFYS
jgi:hypothetical protein